MKTSNVMSMEQCKRCKKRKKQDEFLCFVNDQFEKLCQGYKGEIDAAINEIRKQVDEAQPVTAKAFYDTLFLLYFEGLVTGAGLKKKKAAAATHSERVDG